MALTRATESKTSDGTGWRHLDAPDGNDAIAPFRRVDPRAIGGVDH